MNPNWWQKAALWILTGLVALTSGICIIVLFTMCYPSKALWDTSLVMQSATCRDIWILIDYAIFMGAKCSGSENGVTSLTCLAFSAFTDLYIDLSESRSSTTQYVCVEENCAVFRFGTGFGVSMIGGFRCWLC